MKKVRANDLIVMYRVSGVWKAIAFATSCEIDISADMIETSSSVTGKWKTFVKKEKGKCRLDASPMIPFLKIMKNGFQIV